MAGCGGAGWEGRAGIHGPGWNN